MRKVHTSNDDHFVEVILEITERGQQKCCINVYGAAECSLLTKVEYHSAELMEAKTILGSLPVHSEVSSTKLEIHCYFIV